MDLTKLIQALQQKKVITKELSEEPIQFLAGYTIGINVAINLFKIYGYQLCNDEEKEQLRKSFSKNEEKEKNELIQQICIADDIVKILIKINEITYIKNQ